MAFPADAFAIGTSLRVPGLGLLVLPAGAAPAWLHGLALHTALAMRLHRAGQTALSLTATIEEVAQAGQLPTRALLLDADPKGAILAGSWLELVQAVPQELD